MKDSFKRQSDKVQNPSVVLGWRPSWPRGGPLVNTNTNNKQDENCIYKCGCWSEDKLARRRAVGKYKYKYNTNKMKVVFTSVVAGWRTSLPEGGSLKYEYNNKK